jgi:hypothetical protein
LEEKRKNVLVFIAVASRVENSATCRPAQQCMARESICHALSWPGTTQCFDSSSFFGISAKSADQLLQNKIKLFLSVDDKENWV